MSKKNSPESLMMSYAYSPDMSQGSIKPPVFQTSTFAFQTAEEGKAFFEIAYGIREKEQDEELGMIYSRIDNPNLSILEKRLCLWDKADAGAVFESGMAAISTVFLEFLKPDDLLVYSIPSYGGTDHFIKHFLQKIGVHAIGIDAKQNKTNIIKFIKASGHADKLAMIYLETPANPTNDLFDIVMCKEIGKQFSDKDKEVILAVDNTFMGPIWSHPLEHGADLVLYSATKYLGGHSDLIAGAVVGKQEFMQRVKVLRTFLGNMASPHTSWLLLRSLETLKVRMEQQAKNAEIIAKFLQEHSKVERVMYLGNISESDASYPIFKRQYSSGGAMISIILRGKEEDAFRFLNHLTLVKLAVSLGSTESLAQHPASMTHIDLDAELKEKAGITEGLVRLSVGLENVEDLVTDLEKALEKV